MRKVATVKIERDDLPTGTSSHGPASEQIVASAGAKLPGISVAIVEPDLQTGQLFSDWVQSAGGFCLLSYHSTAEGTLLTLPDQKPGIVLIGFEVPGESALDRIRQLKLVLQHTQIVILLARYDTEYVFNAIIAGATGYALKGTPCAELLANLRHIHAGGSPINRELARRVLQFFQDQRSGPAHATAELSPREKRLLRLLSDGSSSSEVANSLQISLPMVSTYIRSIYEKVHLRGAR